MEKPHTLKDVAGVLLSPLETSLESFSCPMKASICPQDTKAVICFKPIRTIEFHSRMVLIDHSRDKKREQGEGTFPNISWVV